MGGGGMAGDGGLCPGGGVGLWGGWIWEAGGIKGGKWGGGDEGEGGK